MLQDPCHIHVSYSNKLVRPSILISNRSMFQVMTENDFTDATSMVPNRRYGRRKINLAPSTSKSSKEEKDAGLKDEPYETFKEQICVVCAKELDLEGIEELHNIYTDNSSNGSNLYDVFRALVKQDIQSTFYGSKVSLLCSCNAYLVKVFF